jgi:hypothetical protein
MFARTLSPLCFRTTSSIMKSFILTTSALAGLASADYNVERHQEECNAGVVVDCVWNWGVGDDARARPGGGWLPCHPTCGEGHSSRYRNIIMAACNGGTCPPVVQRKVCMDKV